MTLEEEEPLVSLCCRRQRYHLHPQPAGWSLNDNGELNPKPRAQPTPRRRSSSTDLRQRAARPLSGRLLAAGGGFRTRGFLVTLLALPLRGQGRHLFNPAEGRAAPRLAVAGLHLQVTDRVMGAAVGVIFAAHSLKHRSAYQRRVAFESSLKRLKHLEE